MSTRKIDLVVGIVGPCAAGKSTLVDHLIKAGIHARHIAQEHSYIPDMWLRITHPDYLIYLDVSYPVTLQRCQLSWTMEEFTEQLRRLRHARQNAHIIIQTDHLSPHEVFEKAINFIRKAV